MQDLDETYLITWGGFPHIPGFKPAPWRYVSPAELVDFLKERVVDGFAFPLNPKWLLCDPGFYQLFEAQLANDASRAALDKWFPKDSGISERLAAVHAAHPDGFVPLERSQSEEAPQEHDLDQDMAEARLKRYITLQRAKRKLRAVLVRHLGIRTRAAHGWPALSCWSVAAALTWRVSGVRQFFIKLGKELAEQRKQGRRLSLIAGRGPAGAAGGAIDGSGSADKGGVLGLGAIAELGPDEGRLAHRGRLMVTLESATGLPDECVMTFCIGHRARSQYLPGGEADISFEGTLGALCGSGLLLKISPQSHPSASSSTPEESEVVAELLVSLESLHYDDTVSFEEELPDERGQLIFSVGWLPAGTETYTASAAGIGATGYDGEGGGDESSGVSSEDDAVAEEGGANDDIVYDLYEAYAVTVPE